MIYLIRNETNGAIKVGYSANVEARLASLRTATPDVLTLLGTVEGGLEEERKLHQRFHRKRSRGEWFDLDEHDCRAILRPLGLVAAFGSHVMCHLLDSRDVACTCEGAGTCPAHVLIAEFYKRMPMFDPAGQFPTDAEWERADRAEAEAYARQADMEAIATMRARGEW